MAILGSFLVLFVVLVSSVVQGNDFSNKPSGACCVVHQQNPHERTLTHCIEAPGDYCNHLGGDYKGDFERCQPEHGHPCAGACCTPHGCEEVVESHCREMHGAFTRAGTRCSDHSVNYCDHSLTGACCYKEDPDNPHDFGSCKVETFVDCYSGKHHPKGDFWTDRTNCDQPGICPFFFVPYVQPLPISHVKKPDWGKSGCEGLEDGDYEPIYHHSSKKTPRAQYTIKAQEFRHQFYPYLPNGQLTFGYDAMFPGPCIVACQGVPIEVKYINDLPNHPHPLGFDSCVHGSDFLENTLSTSVHLHGGRQPTRYDGWPEALVYPDQSYEYYYENIQHPTCLFYHDHALGITRKNVMMGLAGPYVIRGLHEPHLPSGKFELSLLLMDKSFTWKDGKVEIYYPPTYSVTKPFVADEFVGTAAIVNGVVNPYLEVNPTQYRFRVTNGANSRAFVLNFVKVQKDGSIVDLPFYVIGSDQGFLTHPHKVYYTCLLSAERADIIFDFSSFEEGDKVWLVNDAPTPFPYGSNRAKHYTAINSEYDLPELMEFRVVGEHHEEHFELPSRLLEDFHPLPISEARLVRSFLLTDVRRNYSKSCHVHKFEINRFKKDRDPSQGFYEDSWNAKDYLNQHFIPLLNSIEIWEFWNPTFMSHPIHMHGFPFQILSIRRVHSEDEFRPETMRLTHEHINLLATETAWKDTVEIHPRSMTTIIIKFDEVTGKFPMHCHMLEHEDNEMMRQFRVIDPKHPCQIESAAKCGNSICEAGNGENCINCPFDCLGSPNSHFCCGYGQDEHHHTNFIGCGPIIQLHPGETRACQKLSPHSDFLLDVSCRDDYVDKCCYGDWCDY